MKNHRTVPFLLTLPLLLLSSCSFSFNIVSRTATRTFTFTNYVGAKEGEEITSRKTRSMSLRVHNDAEEVAYVTLKDYNELLTPFYREGVSASFSGDNLWKLSNANGQVSFICEAKSDCLEYAGSLYGLMKANEDRYPGNTLYYRTQLSQKLIAGKSNPTTRSLNYLKHYSPEVVSGSVYLPLGVLDAEFYSDIGFSHLYAYSRGFYEVEDAAKINQKCLDGGVETTLSKILYNEIKDQGFNGMPKRVGLYDYDVLAYTFKNRYGLKYALGIDQFSTFFDSLRLDEAYSSGNNATRLNKLGRLLSLLNDGHTGPRSICGWWGEKVEDLGDYRGKMWNERINLRTQLLSTRQSAMLALDKDPHGTLYSTDGKTALIPFDGFTFATDAFDADRELLPKVYEHDNDTFYFLLRSIGEAISSGAKDVILDLSCNGGGAVAVLAKLLALISPDNHGLIHTYQTDCGYITELDARVDTNNDSVYDEDDTFYGKASFYLLCSPYSFSCGNAMPFYARHAGYAKVIGTSSGGGECTVGTAALPSGMALSFSSPARIGIYDAEKSLFYGDEAGSGVDIPVDFASYANVDSLSDAIKA
ncbi:MAG: S41 family peptidase [Bacilli bacterium]|nr:S41 family peptidase [Bacilli bacterium]